MTTGLMIVLVLLGISSICSNILGLSLDRRLSALEDRQIATPEQEKQS